MFINVQHRHLRPGREGAPHPGPVQLPAPDQAGPAGLRRSSRLGSGGERDGHTGGIRVKGLQ